ncbi:PLP-dependent aminotransferase family protein [Pseudomonas soli]|uniref:aminotransferase-like domain-containing protein n=1 Tax=Pseudomonas soli TaxID=1306993 RepID=UPI001364DEF0|nr:PLP-dependent aminotransferase family protein [Pseudomonas soli]NBK37624.1 PLP-dependent aminotransferase family protein [Pseudomonas soli]
MDRNPKPDKRWHTVNTWLLRQIDSGEWPTGTQLPSVRELARLFDSSLATVQRALAELEANAYVQATPRVGYFVAKGAAQVQGFDLASVSVNVNHAVVAMLAQAAGNGGLSLSSAVLHDELTPQVLLNKCLMALASKADQPLAGLIAPPGLASLRRRIAGLMLQRGVACGPDEILVTSGDTVALELALEAVAQPGATVAIETPTYYGILQTIERLGMRALPMRTHAGSGMDLEHLAWALKRKKVDVIFLNPTLQNPRGFIMHDAARAELSRLAQAADVPIIEDDIFFDLVDEPQRPKAIKHYDTTGQTIYCSSFSKTVAPGYRVGWCVVGRYRDAILAQLFSRNLAVSSLAQRVLDEFIGRGYMEAHCAKLRGRLTAQAEVMEMLVRSDFPPGTRYVAPDGGFIHWLELPEGTDMAALRGLTAEQGCKVGDSGMFFADGECGTGLRVCLGRVITPEVMGGLRVLAACARQAQVPCLS